MLRRSDDRKSLIGIEVSVRVTCGTYNYSGAGSQILLVDNVNQVLNACGDK